MVKERTTNPNKSSLEILADINKLQKQGQCTDANWQSYLWFWNNPSKQFANDYSWLVSSSDLRSSLSSPMSIIPHTSSSCILNSSSLSKYQTCSEFGFYQTCNKDSNCPYSKGYHDVSRDLEICQAAFGIDAETVKQNVDSTLTYYGGWSLTPDTHGEDMIAAGEDTLDGQKRLIFINGDIDPWQDLSFLNGNENTPSQSVMGASHHVWTHQVKASDTDHVVQARQAIYDTVFGWLGDSLEPTLFTYS